MTFLHDTNDCAIDKSTLFYMYVYYGLCMFFSILFNNLHCVKERYIIATSIWLILAKPMFYIPKIDTLVNWSIFFYIFLIVNEKKFQQTQECFKVDSPAIV
jgi:hypothetical protein